MNLFKNPSIWAQIILMLLLTGCKSKTAESPGDNQEDISEIKPYVIPNGKGDHFVFDNTPELSVDILVDSLSVGSTRYAAGRIYLDKGKNFGTHETGDETIYVLKGEGMVVLDSDTFPAIQGNCYFIPKGTYHGFINNSDSTLVFFWILSYPNDLINRIRGI